jgi:hypothetical protein
VQRFHGIVVAALYKPVAVEGVCDVVVFHGVTASACPSIAEGRERPDSHANAGGVLKGLVAEAEGGRVGDGVQSHPARPGRDAVEEGPFPVGGPKAQQLRVTGCVEGATYVRGQLSELRCSGRGEAMCEGRAVLWESAYIKRGAVGGSEGMQLGGGCGEGCDRTCSRG